MIQVLYTSCAEKALYVERMVCFAGGFIRRGCKVVYFCLSLIYEIPYGACAVFIWYPPGIVPTSVVYHGMICVMDLHTEGVIPP